MRHRSTPRPLALGTSALAVAAALLASAGAGAATAADTAAELPLGPADLAETRTSATLQPGVTWTRIDRGAIDAAVPWVIELGIPSTATSPDPAAPARPVQDRVSAEGHADRLDGAGFPASAQPVTQTAAADVAEGEIGYRVRLDAGFASKAEADAELARVRAAGFAGRTWYAGWDGGSDAGGHWTLHVLTIDPEKFRGEIGGTYGDALETRETTSALAAFEKATAAVNAGFFVFDPTAGAEGDPAGAAVYDGRLMSETIGTRPVLVLDESAAETRITRPAWKGSVRLATGRVTLDGIDRVPGLIRNCGGLDDAPTTTPLHDVTCTDAGELILFDSAFGAVTPQGEGREAVLDAAGRVVRVTGTRGTELRDGERSLQATGERIAELDGLRVGAAVPVSLRLTDAAGDTLVRPRTSVINGGPLLVADGENAVTISADGMVHPGNPSFQYGWVLQRNPRTFAGIDAEGRTVLVTVDGRQRDELGLSIQETADVARALGLTEAINLDGGGSTAMVVDGVLVSHPSDAAGERPVGDAIYIR